MTVAALGAVAVFFLVLNFVAGVSRQVGPLTTVYQFSKPVPVLKPITSDDLEQVRMPLRWLPSAAIQSFDTSRGLVATENIPKGAMLQEGMVGPPPELQPGQREIAIMINAETGVAGKIHPDDLVDIYATFSTQTSAQTETQARVIVANARVLAIGALQQVDSPTSTGGGQFQQDEVVPVTFALSVQDSLKVTYAESFATKVRLALIAPGTRSAASPGDDVLRQAQIFGPAPRPKAG